VLLFLLYLRGNFRENTEKKSLMLLDF